jgi:hypothetical protein
MKNKLTIFMALLVASGCATPRFFTDEEDAKARENCEKDGCAIVPIPLLQMLLNRLNGTRI